LSPAILHEAQKAYSRDDVQVLDQTTLPEATRDQLISTASSHLTVSGDAVLSSSAPTIELMPTGGRGGGGTYIVDYPLTGGAVDPASHLAISIDKNLGSYVSTIQVTIESDGSGGGSELEWRQGRLVRDLVISAGQLATDYAALSGTSSIASPALAHRIVHTGASAGPNSCAESLLATVLTFAMMFACLASLAFAARGLFMECLAAAGSGIATFTVAIVYCTQCTAPSAGSSQPNKKQCTTLDGT
jgi:hypothetical protein